MEGEKNGLIYSILGDYGRHIRVTLAGTRDT